MSERWLLDTCVLSEYARAKPDARVMRWLADADEESLALSVLTLAELRRGALALPSSRRRSALAAWIDESLPARFHGRVFSVDKTVTDVWAERQARLDRYGRPLPVFDGLIAATALAHGYGVATRNERDFVDFGVSIVNPWRA
ncbi:MAG: type II toxin-antitoxin system VapC family toxin [Burkholderiaceae bacterium]|nr:type II toxin-antitoxin system VapC family toxin [Burkholderiaceae bacterium]